MGDQGDSSRPRRDDALPSVELGEASNVLLLGSPMDERTLETGLSLAAGERPAGARVVWVTMLNSSREVLDIWDGHVRARPEQFRIVLVGDGLADAGVVTDAGVETEGLDDPTDLVTLGIRLLETVSTWADEDGEVRLRFDSLTPLLQYVEPRALAQFLHVLTNRLDLAGVTAHYHLDPMAHDSQTVHALASICDAQVTVDGDGVSVDHR
ncbi:DUF7504 family protein [Salinigranum sp. GCM10025319]|uniref:DUF7504 family protein n=1 Tax=Salinigranum sp. GCM10025319 TaxID=3252687 RepID=UPI003609F044